MMPPCSKGELCLPTCGDTCLCSAHPQLDWSTANWLVTLGLWMQLSPPSKLPHLLSTCFLVSWYQQWGTFSVAATVVVGANGCHGGQRVDTISSNLRLHWPAQSRCEYLLMWESGWLSDPTDWLRSTRDCGQPVTSERERERERGRESNSNGAHVSIADTCSRQRFSAVYLSNYTQLTILTW